MLTAACSTSSSLLVVALSVLIGGSLGLLGGGGSILAVPVLVYTAGLAPRDAIATSLLMVGTTSLVAMGARARAGHVDVRTGVLFGLTSMVGAFGGGRLAHALPERLLFGGFTAMMLVTAVAMMRRRGRARAGAARGLSSLRAAALGVGVGALTGLVGAGGGFVIVPALTLLAGLSMETAVGTSLLVIAMNSAAGFAGAVGHASVPWLLALAATGAAVAGSLVGVALARRLEPASLRRGFAWFVLVMGVVMAAKQALAQGVVGSPT